MRGKYPIPEDQLYFRSRIEAAVFWGLALLLVWAPLPFGSNRPWAVGILVIWVALLAGLWMFGWLIGVVRLGSSWRKGSLPLALLVGWLVIIGLQVVPLPMLLLKGLSGGAAEAYGAAYAGQTRTAGFLSVEAGATLRYFGLSVALTAYFALLLVVVRDEARLRILCHTLVLSGTFQSILGVYLFFTGARYNLFFEEVIHGMHLYPSGTFVNRNHFAAFLEICLGIGAGLMVAQFRPGTARTWKQRVRWLADLLLSSKARLRILLVIMVMGLILTRSRMGNGALFAAIFAGAAVGLVFSKLPRRPLIIFLVSMLVLDVFVIGSWIGVDKVMERMKQTSILSSEQAATTSRSDVAGDSFQERVGPGTGALAALKDYPFFGTGGGTFYVAFPRYRPDGSAGFFDHAHMDYAEFASDGGLPGAILLLVFGGTSFAMCIYVLKTRSNPLFRGVVFGGFMGMVAVGLHATVEFMLQIPAVAFAFVTLCATPWICQKQPFSWFGGRLRSEDDSPVEYVSSRSHPPAQVAA
jgi:hypothetical protein